MQDSEVNIIQTIFIVTKEKKYSFDVDSSTNFYELKRILSSAAHLIKNSFSIFHEGEDYTDNYDNNTLDEIFPGLKQIIFELNILNDQIPNPNEEDHISVKLNINEPCEEHVGKFKMLYCFTCNKSICTDCVILHNEHNIKEKADYLMPAKFIMNKIFADSYLYKADPSLSMYSQSVSFRNNLKINIFSQLRAAIDELERKCNSCLEFFSRIEDKTEKNIDSNIELLKQYCIESFIKLKNDINTKGIIIQDEVFLALYNKLQEIKFYKNNLFMINKKKYETLNTFLAPFINDLQNITQDITQTITNHINSDIYDTFSTNIQNNIIELITKEEVNLKMFENINLPRRTTDGLMFRILIKSDKKNNSASQGQNKSDYKYNNGELDFQLSREEIERRSSKRSKSGSKEQPERTSVQMKVNHIYQSSAKKKGINGTSINQGKSAGGNNNNEMNETNILQRKSYERISMTQEPQSSFHEMFQGSDVTSNQNIQVVKEIKTTTTTNITKMNSKEEIKTNKFGDGNKPGLIEAISQKIEEHSVEVPVFPQSSGQTVNIHQFRKSNLSINGEGFVNKKFYYMYPEFQTNLIKGSMGGLSVGELQVDFSQAYSNKDTPITVFPEGGAYCNSGEYLYFSGGTEILKGINKIFFRCFLSSDFKKIIVVKLPSLIFSHSNHSMIFYKNQIYAIGGYNSNRCERYDIKSSKWSMMADMNSIERQRPILLVESNYLYTFMGLSQFNSVESIERINLNNLSAKWENIFFENPDNIRLGFYGSATFKLKNKNAYIFLGGKFSFDESLDDYIGDIFGFSFDEKKFIMYLKVNENMEKDHLVFLENQLHQGEGDEYGNFIRLEQGYLINFDSKELNALGSKN